MPKALKRFICVVCVLLILFLLFYITFPYFEEDYKYCIESVTYYFNDYPGTRHLYDRDGFRTEILPGYMQITPGPFEYCAQYYVARVKYVKTKRHLSKEKRAEYLFEVVEWINTDVEKKADIDLKDEEISIYCEAYPLKWKSVYEIYESDGRLEYNTESEYVVTFGANEDGKLKFVGYTYVDLEKIDGKTEIFGHRMIHPFDNKYGLSEDMSPDEVVAKIKELIAEEKAKAEE